MRRSAFRFLLLLRLACVYGLRGGVRPTVNMVASTKRATSSTTVSLAEVLSTLVDAASRGCSEIRDVQSRRDAGSELSVAMKDQADVRSALTEADLAAQLAIIGALREAWPGLTIIGEEDEEESAGAAASTDAKKTRPPLRRDLCAELCTPGLQAPLDELCVFVDPLDGRLVCPLHPLQPQHPLRPPHTLRYLRYSPGPLLLPLGRAQDPGCPLLTGTREFVEGRLANVQSLVGLARRGRPVAGAVGLPLPTQTPTRSSCTV